MVGFFILLILAYFNRVDSAELGAGSGSGYPAAIDTDTSVESSTTIARADVPNDLADAIINTQTELGITPSGSTDTVAARFEYSVADLDRNKYRVTNSSDIFINSGQKLAVGDSDDYIAQLGGDGTMSLVTNDTTAILISTGQVVTFAEDIIIPSGSKITLGGDDDYIAQLGGDGTLSIVTNDVTAIFVSTAQIVTAGAGLAVNSGSKVAFGGTDDYIAQLAGDGTLSIVTNDATAISVSTDQIVGFAGGINVTSADLSPASDGATDLGTGTADDWDTIYYHTLSQDCSQVKKKDITEVRADTFDIYRLPIPKTYERLKSTTNAQGEFIVTEEGTGVIEYGYIAEDCPAEVIKYDDKGNPMVQTNALISYMVGVIKEMDKRIKILELLEVGN
jgi:hypothetical protein